MESIVEKYQNICCLLFEKVAQPCLLPITMGIAISICKILAICFSVMGAYMYLIGELELGDLCFFISVSFAGLAEIFQIIKDTDWSDLFPLFPEMQTRHKPLPFFSFLIA